MQKKKEENSVIILWKKKHGNQWLPSAVGYQHSSKYILNNIYCVQQKWKLIQFWNKWRVRKWWQHFNIGQIIYVWHIILCANKQLLGDNHVIEINAVLIKYDFLCLLKCEDK